ncbi:MAG: ribosome-recycling factor [bacterium]|nr:ribosome-recycling factor [bacterium]
MDTKTIISNTRPKCEKALDFFTKELAKMRTGHATPALVEDVPVEVSGQKLPLKHVASISCPEARQILVQPWDHSHLEPIEKALLKASIGASPITDKTSVRMHLPQLTQEFRKSLLKVLGEKQESCKQIIRREREEAWGTMQDLARKGEMGEDEKFRGKEGLQKMVDEMTKRIDELTTRKEKEIIET